MGGSGTGGGGTGSGIGGVVGGNGSVMVTVRAYPPAAEGKPWGWRAPTTGRSGGGQGPEHPVGGVGVVGDDEVDT